MFRTSRWYYHAVRSLALVSLTTTFCVAQLPVENTNTAGVGNSRIAYSAEVRYLTIQAHEADVDGTGIVEDLLTSTHARQVEVQSHGRVDGPLIPDRDQNNTTNKIKTSVLVAQLSRDSVENLLRRARGDLNINICQTPNAVFHAGEKAEVSDTWDEKFMNPLNPTGNNPISPQSAADPVREGLTIKITASPGGDRISLQTTIETCQVRNVETLNLGNGSGNPMRVQFPDVTVMSVSASGQVSPGETLLVVPGRSFTPPRKFRAETGPRFFRKTVLKQANVRTAILVTVREIDSVSLNPPRQSGRLVDSSR